MRAEYDFSKGKRGAVLPTVGKTRISIFIDNSVLDQFRAKSEQSGVGYQTMINEVLKDFLAKECPPLTETTLRAVLKELLPVNDAVLTSRSSRTVRKRAAA